MANMAMMQLTVNELTIDFSGHRHLAFSEVEWNFDERHPLIILRGNNGSGKTTFLNVLSGHIRPSRGCAYLDGTLISGRGPAWAVKRGVVRGFQLSILCNELKVWENIALPLLKNWWKRAGNLRQLAVRQLTRAEFDHLAGFSPAELSYGQRRLVELMRLDLQLNHSDVRLVLLDEPLAGLDPVRRSEALRLVKSILETGVPTIIVEHDLNLDELSEFSVDVELVSQDGGTKRFQSLNRH